jgi:hypothetical protein
MTLLACLEVKAPRMNWFPALLEYLGLAVSR